MKRPKGKAKPRSSTEASGHAEGASRLPAAGISAKVVARSGNARVTTFATDTSATITGPTTITVELCAPSSSFPGPSVAGGAVPVAALPLKYITWGRGGVVAAVAPPLAPSGAAGGGAAAGAGAPEEERSLLRDLAPGKWRLLSVGGGSVGLRAAPREVSAALTAAHADSAASGGRPYALVFGTVLESSAPIATAEPLAKAGTSNDAQQHRPQFSAPPTPPMSQPTAGAAAATYAATSATAENTASSAAGTAAGTVAASGAGRTNSSGGDADGGGGEPRGSDPHGAAVASMLLEVYVRAGGSSLGASRLDAARVILEIGIGEEFDNLPRFPTADDPRDGGGSGEDGAGDRGGGGGGGDGDGSNRRGGGAASRSSVGAVGSSGRVACGARLRLRRRGFAVGLDGVGRVAGEADNAEAARAGTVLRGVDLVTGDAAPLRRENGGSGGGGGGGGAFGSGSANYDAATHKDDGCGCIPGNSGPGGLMIGGRLPFRDACFDGACGVFVLCSVGGKVPQPPATHTLHQSTVPFAHTLADHVFKGPPCGQTVPHGAPASLVRACLARASRTPC